MVNIDPWSAQFEKLNSVRPYSKELGANSAIAATIGMMDPVRIT
jgi:hypothetical protein